MPTFSKTLASGQLAATPAALYTVPQMVMTRVRCIRCQNAGAGDNTVTLAVQESGGTARNVTVVTLAAGDMLIDTGRLDLETGDALSPYRPDGLISELASVGSDVTMPA